jgi:hypothetical protein
MSRPGGWVRAGYVTEELNGDVIDDESAPAAVPSGGALEWSLHVRRLLVEELRLAAQRDLLTVGEAQELTARLLLVIDQALTKSPP